MMTDPDIAATGVISVVSNIAPKAMSDLVRLLVSTMRPKRQKGWPTPCGRCSDW
jgi:dihydrodipicolinate synthase/N-acetylneuraminate lyase